MSSLMSEGRPKKVRQIEMIRVVHLTDDAYMKLICSPFEFFPFWVDLLNFSSRPRLLEPAGIGYPLRGSLVMKFMSFLVIVIGWLSQISPSWYLLMRNLAASSFRVPKLSMMGALR